VQDRPVPRSHALRAKLEAVGWVMVRFLRRHSLEKSGSQNSRSSSSSHYQQYYLDRGEQQAEMHEPSGNGTPPLPHGRAAVAGAPRSRFARDGPPSGTHACMHFIFTKQSVTLLIPSCC
jgi:hypothetical protein